MPTKCLAIFAIVIICLGGCASSDHRPIIPLPKDNNRYESWQTPSGLTIVLAEDPEATQAHAMLRVEAGFWSDPDTHLGLAHFVEHMMFGRSAKFDERSPIHQFAESHGGFANAFTAERDTVYYVTLEDAFLMPMLDRLSAGLTQPLFDAESVAAEMSALESEFQLRSAGEGRQVLAVLKSQLNPHHPASRFHSGNRRSLSMHDTEQLLSAARLFYQQHYRPERMTLVIVSAQALGTVREALPAYLNGLDRAQSKARSTQWRARAPFSTISPLGAAQLQRRIYVRAPDTTDRLALDFVLPIATRETCARPADYLQHFLFAMDEGAFVPALREAGLLHQMRSSYNAAGYDSQDAFSIEFELTDTGRRQEALVLASFFVYLEKMISEADFQGLYDYCVAEVQRSFRDNEAPQGMALAETLLWNSLYVPREEVLVGGYRPGKLDIAALRQQLRAITPEAMRVIDIHPQHQGDLSLPDFPIRYRSEAYDARAAMAGIAALAMTIPPAPQQAKATVAVEQYLTETLRVVDDKGLSVWLGHSQQFPSEEGLLRAHFSSELPLRTVDDFVMSHVLHNLIKKDVAALAQKAALEERVDLSVDNNVFAQTTLRIFGPTATHMENFSDVLQALHNVSITQARIDEEVKPYVESMDRLLHAAPDAIAQMQYSQDMNRAPMQFSALQKKQALLRLEVKALQQFHRALMDDAFVDIFLYGNYSVNDAKAFGGTVRENFDMRHRQAGKHKPRETLPVTWQDHRVVTLPSEKSGVAYTRYFIWPETSLRHHYATQAVAFFLAGPFFQNFRTENKIAYSPVLRASWSHENPALELRIVSSNTSIDVIHPLVQQFLHEGETMLANLSDESLQLFKRQHSEHFHRQDKNMHDELTEAFHRWQAQPGVYVSDAERIGAIEALTREDLLVVYRELVLEARGADLRYLGIGVDFQSRGASPLP